MYPGQQNYCPNCLQLESIRVQLEQARNQLHQQIADQIAKINGLEADLAQSRQLATNLKQNAENDQKRINEMMEKSRLIEEAASEKWKMVAIALDCELPERGPGLDYQGPVVYTADYIFRCVTELRAKLTIASEIIKNLQGRIALQKGAFAEQLKAIGNTMVNQHMLEIDSPKED